MHAPDPSGPGLVMVGITHRTSPADLLDNAIDAIGDGPSRLAALAEMGLPHAVWISTCDRVEIAVAHDMPDTVAAVFKGVLRSRLAVDPGVLDALVMVRPNSAALYHLFAIAASLDAQVPGEPNILGQIKAAYRDAVDLGMTTPFLDAVFQAAFATAKRVRRETTIGERPVTIGASAVDVARRLHGRLDRCRGLVIGLGEMGLLLADRLRDGGLTTIVLAGAAPRRLAAAASAIGADIAPDTSMESLLVDADIVVAAASDPRHRIEKDWVDQALRKRRHKPILVVDAAVPSAIDPSIADLDDAFSYGLDDLERVAQIGMASRDAALGNAQTIIEKAVTSFYAGRAERDAVPEIRALRQRFDATRASVLEQGRHLSVDEATRLLINRLLHDPTLALRAAAVRQDVALGDAVRTLFNLDRTMSGNGDDTL